jgi:hypothetical protein
MLNNMNIIFAFTFFPIFEWPAVQIWIIQWNSIKQTKSNSYSKHFDNCAKIEHVSLYTVGKCHKKFGGKTKKCKYSLPSVKERHSTKYIVPSANRWALGKEAILSSVNVWHSAKLTAVSYSWLLMALCRASFFAESLTLDKKVFVECL